MSAVIEQKSQVKSSADFADLLRKKEFGHHAVTVVGHGAMGQQYVKALQALKVEEIQVCSRSEKSLSSLKGTAIKTQAGGFQKMTNAAKPGELAIISTPTDDLVPALRHLLSLGYRKILCEKPVSLWSAEIDQLAETAQESKVDVMCAFNRVGYASFLEARYRAAQDGGITTARYEFTELASKLNLSLYSENEKKRWGVANSLHVFSMAHGLIGLPKEATSLQSGGLPWHPASSSFVGHGISTTGVLFSFHADWTSKGRWLVEIHSPQHSYQMCPLERLFYKNNSLEPWQELKVTTFAPEVKPGFTEQVAAMLDSEVRSHIPLYNLKDAAALTRFGEEVFGYAHQGDPSLS